MANVIYDGQQSSVGSPYIYYKVSYDSYRSGTTITINFTVEAWINSGSSFGTGYALILKAGFGNGYTEIRLKETDQSWSGGTRVTRYGSMTITGVGNSNSIYGYTQVVRGDGLGSSGTLYREDNIWFPYPNAPSNITYWNPNQVIAKPNQDVIISFGGATGNDNSITGYQLYFKNERTGVVVVRTIGTVNMYTFNANTIFGAGNVKHKDIIGCTVHTIGNMQDSYGVCVGSKITIKIAGGNIKVNGAWKDSDTSYIKVNGVWKEWDTVHVKSGGVWKEGA